MQCDWCDLEGVECPGVSVHCARGEHCVSVVASCAMEWRGGKNPAGHPCRCEDCGVRLDEKENVK